MLFASFDFLLFLLPVLFGYWALARRPVARWAWLLCASYFFYSASAKPPSGVATTPWYFVALLIFSSLIDFACGLIIAGSRDQRSRKLALVGSIASNLGLLGYFKYTGFAVEVAEDFASLLGFEAALPAFRTALPIGISFYTFQSLSYTIDVYRGQLKAERSLLRFCLFVAFFPQLVAGPIVRARELLPQLTERLRVDLDDVDFAIFRVGKGLFKKVVLGDLIAANFTDLVFATPDRYSSLENLLALYAFTLQIYADFSGYSDIAIGVARLLGFRLPENFDRPYQARDIAEFWRRWHVTLSTWLRDYVFFPLGGSRGGHARTYLNLWITMFLIGMWHGASWNFVIYGNLHALALVYSRFNRYQSEHGDPFYGLVTLLACFVIGLLSFLLLYLLGLELMPALGAGGVIFALTVINSLMPLRKSGGWGLIHVLSTFHVTVLSRAFFRADSVEQAGQMLQKLVQWDSLGVREGLFRLQAPYDWLAARPGVLFESLLPFAQHGLMILIVVGLGYHFLPARWSERLGHKLTRWLPAPAVGVALAFGILVLSQLLDGPRANIYFAF